MITGIDERTVLVDRATFECILAAALTSGRILSHRDDYAEKGFQNILVWPTIDGSNPICFVAGES